VPAWVVQAAPPDADLLMTTQVAKRVADAIVTQRLVPALDAALSLTPITTLVNLGIVTGGSPRLPLAKTQSFERLRLAYADAITAAGL
jgi:hypothetical protein